MALPDISKGAFRFIMSIQTQVYKSHNYMNSLDREVLDSLPDSALWVEARGMLLSGRGTVLDFVSDPAPAGALYQEDIGLAIVIGEPEFDLIHQVSELADEFICPIDHFKYISQHLNGWSHELGSLKQLPLSINLEGFDSTLRSDERSDFLQLRKLKFDELPDIGDLPELLFQELEQEMSMGSQIYCAAENDEPVSFCFAAAISESFWDISIDTLFPYRREGYGESCVRYAISEMSKKGLRPVWGVLDSNKASRYLARKLGFEESYRIAVFTRNN